MATQKEADEQRVKEAVDLLSEHFDNVQIFCNSYKSGGMTSVFAKGHGNWFARIGQIRYWLIRDDEDTRMEQRDADKREEW